MHTLSHQSHPNPRPRVRPHVPILRRPQPVRQQRYPWEIPKEKPMTIATGFVARDYFEFSGASRARVAVATLTALVSLPGGLLVSIWISARLVGLSTPPSLPTGGGWPMLRMSRERIRCTCGLSHPDWKRRSGADYQQHDVLRKAVGRAQSFELKRRTGSYASLPSIFSCVRIGLCGRLWTFPCVRGAV